MNDSLKTAFWLIFVVGGIIGAFVFLIAPSVNQSNRAYEHQQSVQACKAGWYDAYQETVKMGMHRWEAACAKEIDTGGLEGARKAEKQCFIHMDDCGA